MLEKCTDGAKAVVTSLAQQEARRLGDNFIGSEHILLGLLNSWGNAQRILARLGRDSRIVEKNMLAMLWPQPTLTLTPNPDFNPWAKKVIEIAQKEAGDVHVSTEHLLLALLQTDDGFANKALADSGITIEMVRRQIERLNL